jgi:long-chain fatty acid transport protein
MKPRNKFLAAVIAATLTPAVANATNGLFLPGFGMRSQGMGGVGIAYGRDALSVGANPANIVNTGMRGDIGFGVLDAESHAATGADAGAGATPSPYSFDGSSRSQNKYFILPEMGFTMPLTEKLSFGVAVLPNGGGATRYPTNFLSYLSITPPGDKKLGIELYQLIAPITLGYKINDQNAVGVSLALAVQRFRFFGGDAFQAFNLSPTGGVTTITSDPAHLTGNGFDYSYGAGVRLGYLGQYFNGKLSLGLDYNSRSYMTKFDKYRGLFAEQGGFDIPQSYGIGLAFKPVHNLVIAADVTQVLYSEVASIGNRGPGTRPPGNPNSKSLLGLPSHLDPSKALGNDNGMGFGFNDQVVYKLGVQYGLNKKLLVRAGYNYGHSPIPNDQLTFATLAPATTERHYTTGLTYKPSDELEITAMYMYVPSHNQQNLVRQNVVGAAAIGMHQNFFGVGASWVLDPGPVEATEFGDADWAGVNFDGWYAGLGIGQSRFEQFGDYIDAKVSPGSTLLSDNRFSNGWKVYLGYQFNKYLGLEGGYINLNDATAFSKTASSTLLRTNISADGWTLAATGTLPVTTKLAVRGRLGAAYTLVKVTAKDQYGSGPLGPLAVENGDDRYSPYYGLGVSYALADNLDVRTDWDRVDRKHLNIDLFTAGVVLKF